MNKIIWQELKALLAINFLFLTVLSSFSTYENTTNDHDDYVLLNKTLNKIRFKNTNKVLYLEVLNSNNFVIETIKELNEYDSLSNKYKIDSLKQQIGLKSNELNELFNSREYSFLTSQKVKSNWNFEKINDNKTKPYDKNKKVENQIVIYISKPIYSSNGKFALVFVKSTWGGIIIYKKVKSDWIEYKLISPMLY